MYCSLTAPKSPFPASPGPISTAARRMKPPAPGSCCAWPWGPPDDQERTGDVVQGEARTEEGRPQRVEISRRGGGIRQVRQVQARPDEAGVCGEQRARGEDGARCRLSTTGP